MRRLSVCLAALCLILAACDPNPGPLVVTPTAPQRLPTIAFGLLTPFPSPAADLTAQLATAEQQWAAQGIASYRIEVRRASFAASETISLTVQAGQVVSNVVVGCRSAELGPACRTAQYQLDRYTVSGLFATAHSLADNGDRQYAKMRFDLTYGYPTSISYDNPDVSDEEWGIGVLSFQPLK